MGAKPKLRRIRVRPPTTALAPAITTPLGTVTLNEASSLVSQTVRDTLMRLARAGCCITAPPRPVRRVFAERHD
jgi:hypothetical protein